MKHILVVEDERTFANIVGELIQDEGFRCTVAYSAADAEKSFSDIGKGIDAVILDIMMTRTGSFAKEPHTGGETGDLIYKQIRDISKSIPIFIMTAKAKQGLKEQYFVDKRTQVFLKPIDSAMITRLLSALKAL